MTGKTNNRGMRLRRSAATLVESAIVLLLLVLLILGTLDLGLAVFRYNLAAELARIGARAAIVRGLDAPPELPAWDGATAAVGIRELERPLLAACGVSEDEFQVTAVYELDADGESINRIGSPVAVTVTVDYTPIMTAWFGGATMSLTAQSRMTIAN